MSLSVSNLPVSQANTNFKGKYKETKNGNPYYSTNSAAIAGGVLAVPAFLIHALNNNSKSFEQGLKAVELTRGMDLEALDFMKKVFDNSDFKNVLESLLKKSKSQKWINAIFAILASSLTLGSGLIVNGIRNKKARKAADMVNKMGVDEACRENNKIKISDSGTPYYKSKDGKKYGALLGLSSGTIALGYDYLMNKELIKNTLKAGKNSILKIAKEYQLEEATGKFVNKYLKIGGVAALTATLGCFTLGGFIMGAIADRAANRNARKNA